MHFDSQFALGLVVVRVLHTHTHGGVTMPYASGVGRKGGKGWGWDPTVLLKDATQVAYYWASSLEDFTTSK